MAFEADWMSASFLRPVFRAGLELADAAILAQIFGLLEVIIVLPRLLGRLAVVRSQLARECGCFFRFGGWCRFLG